jgi:predicted lipid-binding transport protein (Tim44 family)
MGTVALASFAAVVLAVAAWRWRPQRRRADGVARRSPAASLIAARATRAAGLHPPALDGAEVLEAARARFLRLQAAWDAGDVQALGHLTTPAMLEELLPVLTTRGGGPSRTDVITLHAELLGLEELGAAYLASVEFSGLIRESAEQGAVPFRELWMLACEKDGSPSWRLARQQALF